MENIYCCKCGKSVSSQVPDNTIVRAWVECPECVEKQSEQPIDGDNLTNWLTTLPLDKIVPFMKELINMLVEQELVMITDKGIPCHYHTGNPIV